MLYITNGYLIDPKSGMEGYYDILIKEKKIIKIAEKGTSLADLLKQKGLEQENLQADGLQLQQIDATGKTIVPGLVDVHVHFRDPGFTHKEDIETGAAAAAKGGFTTVVLMANTKPAVDNEDTLHYVLEKGKKTGIHIHTCANVTMGLQGKDLVEMETLSEAGAAGFTDDGIPLMDEEILREALERAAKLGKPISLHEENPTLITNNGVNAGVVAKH